MRVVFGGGLWPIGQLVGFLEAPFGTVVEEMRRWKRSLVARWRERTFEDAPLVQQLEAYSRHIAWLLRIPHPGFYGNGVRFQERALWHWYRRPRRLSIEAARRDYARSSARP